MYKAKPRNPTAILATVVLVSLLTTACGEKKQAAQGARVIPVKLQTLTSGTLVDSSQFVGTLGARRRVSLAPQIDGRVKTVYVNYGQKVNRGQPILLLVPIQQQEQVNAYVGNLNVQQANLTKTEADLRTTEAQRDAAKAEVANQVANVASSKANLANAQEVLKTKEADLTRAKSNQRLAQINYDRAVFLVKEGVSPTQDLDNKTTELNNAKADTLAAQKTVEAAKASVRAAQGSVDAALAALDQTKENLRAAQGRVKSALATINSQKAAISQAEGQLGAVNQDLVFNQVVAPIDGVVANITFKVGDILRNGESFTEITDNSVMEMSINVPTERAKKLQIGLPVEIVNADGSIGVRGEIGFISPTVDQKAQAILTKVFFENDGSLRDRQYIRVRMIWDKKPGVLVPTSAVTSLGGQKFVFVAENVKSEEGKTTLVAKQKPVQLGSIQGQAYQVISGLKPGERIAVSGILDLRDNTPITEETLKTQE